MPNKGYKQTPAHRARIARANAKRAALVKEAVEAYRLNTRPKHKPPKPDPTPTPIPPSASKITNDLPQRWALYSHHAEGQYYYKREQAHTLKELQRCIRQLELTPPFWTYVKNGRNDAELVMPIRIPEAATKALGHRWHKLKG